MTHFGASMDTIFAPTCDSQAFGPGETQPQHRCTVVSRCSKDLHFVSVSAVSAICHPFWRQPGVAWRGVDGACHLVAALSALESLNYALRPRQLEPPGPSQGR
jgi:hypothetical protein